MKYDNQGFLTLIFNELVNTSTAFFSGLKRQRRKWVKKPFVFNTSNFIDYMINLYTNYKSTRKWDKQGADHNKVLVALVTSLKQEHAK